MATTIFSVESKHLSKLGPEEGVSLLRDLLWAEARRIGLPPHKIIISLNTTVKDGGIDAKVEGDPSGGSLLVSGDTLFQIKTGASFKPWRQSDLKKELLGKTRSEPAKQLLSEAVNSCLKQGGRYILITLGHDLLPQQHTQAVNSLRDLLLTCGHKRAKIDVIGIGQLLGYLQNLPSLCLELNGRSDSAFQTVARWAGRADMQPTLKLADSQKQFIEQLQGLIRGSEYQHCRVIGEPGLGKTRIVLDAISAGDIRPSTIYVSTGEDLQRSALFNELLKNDREYSVNLVVDDCDEKDRASIWGALKGKPRLKLVTIDHGPEKSSDSSMRVLQLPPLPNEQIEEILGQYTDKTSDLYKWAEWCSGSPRVAHAVGENLKHNPDDILKSPATVDLWDRFILGHKKRGETEAEQHFLVLRHLALFERFGFESPVSGEAEFLAQIITAADPAITWQKFQQIIRHHKERRILQGRHTLFLVPKALHVNLWLEFWDNHGIRFDVDEMLKRMPSGLMHGFMRLFIYAHGSSVATNAVQRLLSPTDGPFRNSAFLQSEQGTRFIHHLAEANPGMTLRLLELTFGTWSLEHLRSWQTGRQNVVWALEKIAVWRELFPRAARLLSNIALAENSNNANNSRGVLKALFAIGPEWAPTEAAPSDRFQILEGLIRSHDTNERSLGLELCKQWLSTRGPMRVIGVEYQGLKPTVRFWTPKTYGEWFDEWKRVWRFVCDEMRGWPSVEKRRGASLLINGASGLVQYKAISGEVLDTLFELADDPDVDHKELVHFVIHIKRYQPQGFPKRAASRIERLDKKLTGSSLWDRIRRYVLFTDWGEDYDFVNGKAEKIDLVGERIRTLAEELAADDELLRTLVPRLVCSDGIKLGQFGFDVASANINSQLDELVIQIITDSMPCVNGQFVSGYVRGLRKFDQIRSDNVELRLLSEASTRMIGVDCASRCGATVSVLKKLLDLHKSGHVPSWAFHRVGLTATEFGVPKSLVDQVARALKNRPDDHSTETCIELIDHFYLRDGNRDKMPKALIFSILTSEAFLGRGEHPGGFSWHRVATRFLEQNPDHELDLFSFMIENQPQFPAMRAMNYRSQLADGIVVRRPKDTWTIVAKNLESESANAWHLRQWLGDNGSEDHPELGAIRYFAPDDVMSWMRKKPTARLPILGDVLPKTLDAAHGGKLTQMFIEQYGDDKDVSSRLVSRFWLGGWSGSESLYFSRLRDKARQWYAEISSPKVRRWLAGYIEFLNNGIEEARIKEERDF